ncbi:MAG: hypothetical protein LBL59_05655 [Xanthomonadaceae bacterium]|jgi:hypothetical protein|nr:hypothetical protein [Xanthomonadaceae bacterium]
MQGNQGYPHSDRIDGVRRFVLRPPEHTAQPGFGTPDWLADLPVPQSRMELDVSDIESATATLKAAGYPLLAKTRTEPWGEIVTRFLSPEGMLPGLTHTPWTRKS